MDASDHTRTVRQSFSRQTRLFTDRDAVFAAREPAVPWLEPLHPDMIILDVACGAGHVAELVAPRVRQVVGLDVTTELLRIAATRLRDAGVANVLFQEGDAARLPFLDASFDVVYCQAALHHFPDPRPYVAEMARVCRPGGRVVISDMVAPSPRLRGPFDDLHRRIDPSHAATLLDTEITTLLRATVGPLAADPARRRATLPIDRLLTPVADREAVFAALRAELAGGPTTGFAPTEQDGQLLISVTTVAVTATPAGPSPTHR
ncbi:Methyltransferase domain-containing protein [Parafrankia irregularis]|uniref:Methyltransferase domain-containing protein n=1 Tax=Parafrankia irregularis TaxID=795642 RepID=A0A0S4QD69_9ACTN|nr:MULTISPECIES: methyltransferase domain-containing protein [Parafrankia]MBE3199743.1 methyltransferase domain-containing protein [Parafrankia sp. CH37]CUU53584.1 Methyltransferase domain-containing protein [Parafrankia irregularis]